MFYFLLVASEMFLLNKTDFNCPDTQSWTKSNNPEIYNKRYVFELHRGIKQVAVEIKRSLYVFQT